MNVNQNADRLARAIELAGPVSERASSSVNAAALPTLAPHPIAHPENVAENPPSPGASRPTTDAQSPPLDAPPLAFRPAWAQADAEWAQADAIARFRCLQYAQPACVVATNTAGGLGLFAASGLMAAGVAGCGPMSATAAGAKIGLALGSAVASFEGARCALEAFNGITALRFERSHRQLAATQAALPASMPPPAQHMLRVLPPMTEAVVIQNPDEALCLGGPTTGEIALSRAPASAREES